MDTKIPTCPKCFGPATTSFGSKGLSLQCDEFATHRYTAGKRVTYATMTGTDGKTTWFSTYRATAYKNHGKWVVDLTNDCTKMFATVHARGKDVSIDTAAELSEFCGKLAKKYETTAAPAFNFTTETK